MRYLGVNQHFQTKLPVSEFDGLQELLDTHKGIRHVKTTSQFARAYYSGPHSTWAEARQSTNSVDNHTYCSFGVWIYSGSFYSCETFYSLDVGWWSPSYTLCSAQVTFEAEHNTTTVGTGSVRFYLLGFYNDYSSYVPWDTLINSTGYQELGMLTCPAAPTGATINRAFATGRVIYLSIPVTNLAGMKALLDSSSNHANRITLTAVHQSFRNGTSPIQTFYFVYAFRCTLDVYYWSAP
jgi:hypothetical protein